MQNDYPVLKHNKTTTHQRTRSTNTHCRWHFATALIVRYCQSQFVIVHRVWHWQLTRHALNIKKTWDWLFDFLYAYRLSKLVEIQMINRISKKITAHTHVSLTLLDPTGATSDVDIDSHELSSWKVVHQCEHVNTHWWTTFQLLSLWLSMSTWLWSQTTRTHASSKTPQSSRFHNFYVSQLYRAYVTTCCHVGSVELWNVHYSRYTDTTVCWNLDRSWRRMCILLCRLVRWHLT